MDKGQKLYKKALLEASKEKPDYEHSYKYLLAAIELEDYNAMYALETWYLFGRYVKKNYVKGFDLLRRASVGNLPDALYDLAICYEKGRGTKKNKKDAFKNYLTAALYGDKQSIHEVGRCYYHGIGIAKNIKLAKIWLKAAEVLIVE